MRAFAIASSLALLGLIGAMPPAHADTKTYSRSTASTARPSGAVNDLCGQAYVACPTVPV